MKKVNTIKLFIRQAAALNNFFMRAHEFFPRFTLYLQGNCFMFGNIAQKEAGRCCPDGHQIVLKKFCL